MTAVLAVLAFTGFAVPFAMIANGDHERLGCLIIRRLRKPRASVRVRPDAGPVRDYAGPEGTAPVLDPAPGAVPPPPPVMPGAPDPGSGDGRLLARYITACGARDEGRQDP
jgi:hypothetical protein